MSAEAKRLCQPPPTLRPPSCGGRRPCTPSIRRPGPSRSTLQRAPYGP